MNRSYDALFQDASNRYGVPFDWIKAVAITESGLKPTAYRAEPQINDASRGLMQVLMRTAVGLGYTGTADGLFDPATSIDLGTKLLAENISRFGPDFAAVYSAYNSGSSTAYKTNAQVGSNVARAIANLQTVDADIAAQQPAVDENGAVAISDQTASQEDVGTGTIVSTAVIGVIVAGIAAYFLLK